MSLLDRLRKKEEKAAPKAEKKVSATPKKEAKKAEKKAAATKEAPAAKKTDATATASSAATPLENLLIRPVITEKATLTGTYVFEVAGDTNKSEVKKAVQKMYGVTPKKVRIMNVSGKAVRWNQRKGQRRSWKKAIVRLNAGETINVYEGT